MVEMTLVYEGDLRCMLTHGPSGAVIKTDAPVDNYGKGDAFSPTDLVAAAIGSCMMTLMGIAARKLNIDLKGTELTVEKEMAVVPVRRVGVVRVKVQMPAEISLEHRFVLEKAARECPVIQSLHPDVRVEDFFVYPE